MSMHATAQPLPEVSPVSLDLNPPVRPESIDLRALIGHRTSTQASASVESVANLFRMRTPLPQCANRSSGVATIDVVEYD